MEDIGTHEREYRHDVVKDRVRGDTGQGGHEKAGLVEGLRVLRRCSANDTINDPCSQRRDRNILRKISTRVSTRMDPGATVADT